MLYLIAIILPNSFRRIYMHFTCEKCGKEFDVGKFDISRFRCPYCYGGKATAIPKTPISTPIHSVFQDLRLSVGIKDETNAEEPMPPQKKIYGRKKRPKISKSS